LRLKNEDNFNPTMIQKPFPSERVNNFSDAIFAIGITLLVLEIKIPSVDEVRQFGIDGVLIKRIPNLTGFLVSFLVTGLYWKALQLFQLVKAVDNKLLWLNLWLLLFVVLLPFSTALYSYYFWVNEAFFFYCLNLASIGWMTYWMTVYVLKTEAHSQFEDRWTKIRALIAPLVFLLCIPISLASPSIARFGFFSIFLIQFVGDKRMARKRKILASVQMST
jgi:uncharacterized membrane protein